MNKPFKFKAFTVDQDKCAMKVGTDGVLLGAWASLNNDPFSILDIGTGTGIIALQLAQRSQAETIDAIEINDSAFEQAVSNFENSPWADRLFCYHASLHEFSQEMDDKYDLIVSNPPFYHEHYQTPNEARNKARFTSALSFEQLIRATSQLLSEQGTFSLIIPFKEEANFTQLAKEQNLHPVRITRVRGNSTSEMKRSLMEFSFNKRKVYFEELILETSRHQYTSAYCELVKDFYLKM